MKNTLHKKYKGGNKIAKQKGGWFGFFDSKPADGVSDETPSDGKNPLTGIMERATSAASGATGIGQNPGSKITQQLTELKKNHDKSIADANKNYEEENKTNEENKIKSKTKQEETIKKFNEEYNKAKEELEKKKAREIDEAKKTLAELNSALGSPGMGGGRRRRSGARRSAARRSAARNGRSGAHRSKSKTKKRITRKKNRNHKKRTRRYKKQ